MLPGEHPAINPGFTGAPDDPPADLDPRRAPWRLHGPRRPRARRARAARRGQPAGDAPRAQRRVPRLGAGRSPDHPEPSPRLGGAGRLHPRRGPADLRLLLGAPRVRPRPEPRRRRRSGHRHHGLPLGHTPTSWRLGGLAREKQRRPHHRPLEEPIAHPPDRSRKAAKPQRARPQARALGTSRPSAPARDAQPTSASPDVWRHPRPLCGSAPLRETNNADPTTARSKSRSPPNPDRSRRAAEPQRAHLKRGRRGHPDRRHRSGTPSPPPRRGDVGDTPTSWRLGGLARDKQRRPDHRPLEEPIAHPRTGRAKPQSRKELTSSAGVGDLQTVRHRSGTPRPTSASP
jgi:hypothetical protein